jgi:hypothetical protein
MQDPVTFADGHTYDRAALEHYLEEHGGAMTSPLTGATLPHTKFVANSGLALAIKSFLQRTDRPLTKNINPDCEPSPSSAHCVETRAVFVVGSTSTFYCHKRYFGLMKNHVWLLVFYNNLLSLTKFNFFCCNIISYNMTSFEYSSFTLPYMYYIVRTDC